MSNQQTENTRDPILINVNQKLRKKQMANGQTVSRLTALIHRLNFSSLYSRPKRIFALIESENIHDSKCKEMIIHNHRLQQSSASLVWFRGPALQCLKESRTLYKRNILDIRTIKILVSIQVFYPIGSSKIDKAVEE